MADKETDARNTLAMLARQRAEYERGGSVNFQATFGQQITTLLPIAGMTEQEFEALYLVAADADATAFEAQAKAEREHLAEIDRNNRALLREQLGY